MASKRIAKSTVDWAAFAQRVPKNQVDAYRAFKAKSDIFVSRVHRFPESLPAIDFASYRKTVPVPGMVDVFEKAYKAVQVPYPTDKQNLKATIDAEEKQSAEETKQAIANIKQQISEAQAFLEKINSVPGLDVMTQQMYADYFPDEARNPWERPTIWPHTHEHQPGNDHHEIK